MYNRKEKHYNDLIHSAWNTNTIIYVVVCKTDVMLDVMDKSQYRTANIDHLGTFL